MIEQILQGLEAKGYSFLPQILNEEQILRINKFFDEYRGEFRPAKIGMNGSKQRIDSIRGDYTYWLNPINSKGPFVEVFEFLNKLRDQINERFYLGLKEYECHLAYYPPDSFYHRHLDRFNKDSSRTISFVFYLNKSWDISNGGEIVMYDKKGNILDSFSPMPGAFICFLSDEFPHEVRSSNLERRSLTGWMHNKIIY